MTVVDSTYDIPAPQGAQAGVQPLLAAALAVLAVACAVMAAVLKAWALIIPALMLLVGAGFFVGQALSARKQAVVHARLADAGVELTQPGQPARWLRWDDVIGVRSDGEIVEFHVEPEGGRPRGLAVTTTGSWERFDEFTDDVARHLDASRGYTNRVCEFEALPSGGCSNALGCAGQATCQGHTDH